MVDVNEGDRCDLRDQGYTDDQLYAALGALVGVSSAYRDERFLIGLAGGASYATELRKARTEKEPGE